MKLKGVLMINGIVTSLSGMLNAIRRTNITANNIANLATPGFKAARADNVELEGGGVRIGTLTHDDSPGPPLLDPAPGGPTEGSNVDLTTETVNLLLNKRQFEANLNALRAQDEALGHLLDTTDKDTLQQA